jgi:hypothetical protein
VEEYPQDFKSLSDTTLLDPLSPFGTAIKVEVVKPGVKNVTMTIRWHNGQREARLGLVRVDTGDPNGESLF